MRDELLTRIIRAKDWDVSTLEICENCAQNKRTLDALFPKDCTIDTNL